MGRLRRRRVIELVQKQWKRLSVGHTILVLVYGFAFSGPAPQALISFFAAYTYPASFALFPFLPSMNTAVPSRAHRSSSDFFCSISHDVYIPLCTFMSFKISYMLTNPLFLVPLSASPLQILDSHDHAVLYLCVPGARSECALLMLPKCV